MLPLPTMLETYDRINVTHFVQQVRRCTREICYHSPPVFPLSRVPNVSESRSRKIAASTGIRDLLPSRTLVQASRENRTPPP